MTEEQVKEYDDEYDDDDDDDEEEPETKTDAELLKYIPSIKKKIKADLLSFYKEIKPKEEKYHGGGYDYDWISEDILKIVQDIDNDRLKDAYKKYKKWESEAELLMDEEADNKEYADVDLMIPFEIQDLLDDLRGWTDAYYKVKKIEQAEKSYKSAEENLTAFVKSGTLTKEEANCITLIFSKDVKNYKFMKDYIVNVLNKLIIENLNTTIEKHLIWAVQYIKGL
jgi:hypothetical protein